MKMFDWIKENVHIGGLGSIGEFQKEGYFRQYKTAAPKYFGTATATTIDLARPPIESFFWGSRGKPAKNGVVGITPTKTGNCSDTMYYLSHLPECAGQSVDRRIPKINIPDFPKIPDFPEIPQIVFPDIKIPEFPQISFPDIQIGGGGIPSITDEDGKPNYLMLAMLAGIGIIVLKEVG